MNKRTTLALLAAAFLAGVLYASAVMGSGPLGQILGVRGARTVVVLSLDADGRACGSAARGMDCECPPGFSFVGWSPATHSAPGSDSRLPSRGSGAVCLED